ncbi:MAG TPA: indole-3-glycerol phosphate synthase TrpC [Pyrinomonadaceae bacterium]|nr:indole-3-glycerol phosphate synthase TrpC [Pyrinomonadaceae bacterium]
MSGVGKITDTRYLAPETQLPVSLMDILSRIIAAKRGRLEEAKRVCPESELRSEAFAFRKNSTEHALAKALSNERINIIAEFKRKSPSKGVIRDGSNPEVITRSYESGGAAGISVLTEEDHFEGSLKDLRAAKAAVRLPVLRKDFIVEDYQVYESAAAGADALLLIVAALDDEKLSRLRRLAEDQLRMDALVEVHTKEEIQRAAAAGARLIGVNNRNLKTFEVSLDTSVQLATEAPANAILVSESGLNSGADLRRLYGLGYRGFLIGESLMRADRPDEALRELIGEQGTGRRGDGETGRQ